MNEVMRRSACCLLSALLLCSCVGCANSVHEISEGDAAQSSSKNDDAAEQAYKAFTVDALDRIAADDLNNSDKLVLAGAGQPEAGCQSGQSGADNQNICRQKGLPKQYVLCRFHVQTEGAGSLLTCPLQRWTAAHCNH